MPSSRPAVVITLVAALVASVLFLAPGAGAAVPSLTLEMEYQRVGAWNHQTGIDQAMSSPALGDVTGDGQVDLVVGSQDGVVTVFDPTDGRVLRYVEVHLGAQIQASPTLVDVTGDGVRDVVVATLFNQPGQSHVKIYDMTSSTPRKVFDVTDSNIRSVNQAGFFGSPVVGDIDGDGAKEVVATSLGHDLYAWELNGQLVHGFPVHTYDTVLSSPALADVDGDGRKDIVFGGDMDHGQELPAGGYLWVVRGDGSVLPGYPYRISGEVVWSSPAVGDLDADGDLDAVVGTGRYFGTDGRKLYAIDLRSRAPLPGWPVTLSSNTTPSPALANLDGDPQLEVITATTDGRVHRLEHDGGRPWSQCVNAAWAPCDRDYAILASPVIADIDGDSGQEVVIAVNRQLLALSAATGAIESRQWIGANTTSDYAHPSGNAPAVAVRGGKTYVAVSVQREKNGDNRRDSGDAQAVYAWVSPTSATALPWSQFHRNAARTGAIAPTVSGPSAPTGLKNYVNAVYTDLLDRSASADERTYWAGRLASGLPRNEFTSTLARSPEWTGVVIDRLYQQVFGRAADPGGRAYWADLVSKGLRVSEVASHFYGSDEWYRRSPPTGGGGTVEGFVDNLYRRILGREPDANRAYWYDQVRAGANRKTVANAFYLSYESNARRVDQLYRLLLDRPSEPGGRDYWAKRLVTVDDVELAALLTASDEYLAKNR